MNRFSNCMIGRYYPFFLTNGSSSGNQYYLYAIDSPSLSPNLLPYVSLRKMGEKTKVGSGFPGGNGNDLLNILIKKDSQDFRYIIDRKAVNLVREILRPFDVRVEKSSKNFPLIEFKGNTAVQRVLIATLRSLIRQKYYKVSPNRFLDIMLTKTEYGVFRIKGNNKELYLEPVGVYKMTDMERENPIQVNPENLNYPKGKFSVEDDWKISQTFDSVLKKIELDSFNQPNFVD